MTTDERQGLGPLGRRLLLAFVLVALSSIAVLTVAALLGTARGLAASESEERATAAASAASAAAAAYSRAGGWVGADLSVADQVAAQAGARLVVVDADGAPVRTPDNAAGMGPGMGMGSTGTGRGYVEQEVVVEGSRVGTVRLGFGSPTSSAVQQIAWAWILAAAVVAIITALVVAWYVTRRISSPLTRMTRTARTFAAGDRSARADPLDVAAPGELGELARAFDATAEQVERSEEARRRMAADLAHELRTPLAALQAGLEELRDGFVEPDQDRIAALHRQSLRVGRVVEDLAELSAAESASLTLHRAAVDLGRLVDEAVVVARPTVEAAGVSVRTATGAGIVVDGDTDRLHQVIGNLLTNTARHCRPGDHVTVSTGVDDGSAVLVVADDGPGIAPDDLPYVFDRLWRGRADSDARGSGIGLAVVRELVAAHGGTVVAESDGIHGTSFTVRLPLPTGR